MGGYKFGGHVNIGYNPAFDPVTTDQYSATGANASVVAGEGNTLKGNYNYIFGNDNQILGTGSSCQFVVGKENFVSGTATTANTVGGIQNFLQVNTNYCTAFGYLNTINSGSTGAFIAGGGGVVGGTGALAIGWLATGTASYATAIGNARASASSATAVGVGGVAGGTNAIGIGGSASGIKSVAIGSGATASASGNISIGRGSMGAGRLGGFRLNANGGKSISASYQILQSLGATTDATPTKIYLSSGGSTDGNMVIGTSTCVYFEIIVQGTLATSSTVGCIYKLEGVVNRDNQSANNPAFLGSVTKTVIHEEDATMDVGLTIDNTTKALDLTVTGKAATNLNWLATWHCQQNQ